MGAPISGFALASVAAEKTMRQQLDVGILSTLGVLVVYAGLALVYLLTHVMDAISRGFHT